jgi:adsorption protein B
VQIDYCIAACLVPLAIWILLSGLDDLFIGLVYLFSARTRFRWPSAAELDGAPRRRIAILVPLWREDGVIAQMLERNLAVVRYGDYEIFAGVYPNDDPTLGAVLAAARNDPRVHLALCPDNGPTSKGDCLNHAYRAMEEYEAAHGPRFEIVATHDAEDLIHPESLQLINWFSRDYQMVQIPVLPLPTSLSDLTHGVYCDEFAEYQTKDIPARQRLGGFLPANGVGTGFSRMALERLAIERRGMVFDPQCLTEDYETGCCLHALGFRQLFVPLRFVGGKPVATREYFPKGFAAAVRQRSRWVAGIALQGWERHGWRAPWPQRYWFWRDRKGLAGNLLSPVANLIFLYYLAGLLAGGANGGLWEIAPAVPCWLPSLCLATFGLSASQIAMRMWACARVYGWRFAAGVPVRTLWANVVNCAATVEALRQFFASRIHSRALEWRKTDHIYPEPAVSGYAPVTFGD